MATARVCWDRLPCTGLNGKQLRIKVWRKNMRQSPAPSPVVSVAPVTPSLRMLGILGILRRRLLFVFPPFVVGVERLAIVNFLNSVNWGSAVSGSGDIRALPRKSISSYGCRPLVFRSLRRCLRQGTRRPTATVSRLQSCLHSKRGE